MVNLVKPVKEKPVKRKMKPGAGKAKGNSWEGKVAKILTANLPLTFIRSPGSGARVGGKNFEKFGAMFGADAMKIFVSDVVPTNERDAGYNFRWSVECKAYATADTFNHMVAGTSKVYLWFEESVVDAAKVGKKPMLIWKWNNSAHYVMVEDVDTVKYPPQFTMKHIDNGRALHVYIFDKIIVETDFWVEKTNE